jgi:hypothetical protein
LRSILAIVEAKFRNEYARELWERVKGRDSFIDEYISYLDKFFIEKRRNGTAPTVLTNREYINGGKTGEELKAEGK